MIFYYLSYSCQFSLKTLSKLYKYSGNVYRLLFNQF